MLKVNHLTSEFDRVKPQTRPHVIIIGQPERSNIQEQESVPRCTFWFRAHGPFPDSMGRPFPTVFGSRLEERQSRSAVGSGEFQGPASSIRLADEAD